MSHHSTRPSPHGHDDESQNPHLPAATGPVPPGERWHDDDAEPVVGSVGPSGGRIVGNGEKGGTGLERNRGPGRRRSDFMKSAEEGEMNGEQFLFIKAIDAFKQANDRMYPTWTDVLEVVRLLGYRKTMPSELSLRGVEDFQEAADAKANVRRVKPDRQHRKAA